MKIKSIKTIPYNGKVYNIGVSDNNNYYANSILVHNCYVSAASSGEDYEDICGTWKKWMDTFWDINQDGIIRTNKPFQIAIGVLF